MNTPKTPKEQGMKQGKLIVFSAPSGSGKTTLVRHVIKTFPEKFAFSISATSRKPREGEVHGVDYFFLSEADFKARIAARDFVEYEEVYQGVFYGTLHSELVRVWAAQKTVLFDVDVVGGLHIKKQFPQDTLALFIQPPSIEALASRLQKRGTETEEAIQKRISKAAAEMEYASQFDHVVVNEYLKDAKQEVIHLVQKFCHV